jgi:hypothetical protein
MPFIISRRLLRINEKWEGWGLKEGTVKSLKAYKKPNPYPLKGNGMMLANVMCRVCGSFVKTI